MFFDSKNFGLADVAIAMELAEKIDNGEPKAKLSDSIRRGLARLWQRGSEAVGQSPNEECIEGTPEPAQS